MFIEIMIGALKPEIIDAIRIELGGGIGNYDVFPIAQIPDEDPEGNYDSMVLCYIGDLPIFYSDLKPETFEVLGWKGE